MTAISATMVLHGVRTRDREKERRTPAAQYAVKRIQERIVRAVVRTTTLRRSEKRRYAQGAAARAGLVREEERGEGPEQREDERDGACEEEQEDHDQVQRIPRAVRSEIGDRDGGGKEGADSRGGDHERRTRSQSRTCRRDRLPQSRFDPLHRSRSSAASS